MAQSHGLAISSQTISNTGQPVSVVNLTWPAITPVQVIAGQTLGGANFTLNTAAVPSSFPTSGSLLINSSDQFGNGLQTEVTYTSISGQSFTGCNGGTGTTVAAPADPVLTATVQIDRSGSGNHPWMDTLTTASVLTISVQSSADGGAIWQDEASASDTGGPKTDPHSGLALTEITLGVGPINPTAAAARILCSAAGPSNIQIAGTITVTSL